MGYWVLGIGYWGVGIGDWEEYLIPDPYSPVPAKLFSYTGQTASPPENPPVRRAGALRWGFRRPHSTAPGGCPAARIRRRRAGAKPAPAPVAARDGVCPVCPLRPPPAKPSRGRPRILRPSRCRRAETRGSGQSRRPEAVPASVPGCWADDSTYPGRTPRHPKRDRRRPDRGDRYARKSRPAREAQVESLTTLPPSHNGCGCSDSQRLPADGLIPYPHPGGNSALLLAAAAGRSVCARPPTPLPTPSVGQKQLPVGRQAGQRRRYLSGQRPGRKYLHNQ